MSNLKTVSAGFTRSLTAGAFWIVCTIICSFLLALSPLLGVFCVLAYAYLKFIKRRVMTIKSFDRLQDAFIRGHVEDSSVVEEISFDTVVGTVGMRAHLFHVECQKRTAAKAHTVFLVHGTAATAISYIDIIESLSQEFNVFSLNLPGFGVTVTHEPFPFSTMTTSMTVEFYADFIERCREHLGVENFSLLGHSYGAFLCINYVNKYPGRVTHFLIADACGIFPTLGRQGMYWALVFKCGGTSAVRHLGSLGKFFFYTVFRLLDISDEAYYWYEIAADKQTWGDKLLANFITLTWNGAYWNTPCFEILGQLECIIQTAYGENDPIVPSHQGEVISRTLGIDTHVIEGAGHAVTWGTEGDKLADLFINMRTTAIPRASRKVIEIGDWSSYRSSFSISLTDAVITELYEKLVNLL